MSDVVSQLKSFWDSRYRGSEYAYGTEPNDYLVTQMALIPKGGRVLCLADGEGRNSVFLAENGFQVTAVELSSEGIEKAKRLASQRGVTVTFIEADVNAVEIKPAAWDGIVSIFLHLPRKLRQGLHQRILHGLSPGGVYLYEAYTLDQLGKGTGGPKEPQVLAAPQEGLEDFPPELVHHFFAGERPIHEGPLHSGEGAIAQLTIKN